MKIPKNVSSGGGCMRTPISPWPNWTDRTGKTISHSACWRAIKKLCYCLLLNLLTCIWATTTSTTSSFCLIGLFLQKLLQVGPGTPKKNFWRLLKQGFYWSDTNANQQCQSIEQVVMGLWTNYNYYYHNKLLFLKHLMNNNKQTTTEIHIYRWYFSCLCDSNFS